MIAPAGLLDRRLAARARLGVQPHRRAARPLLLRPPLQLRLFGRNALALGVLREPLDPLSVALGLHLARLLLADLPRQIHLRPRDQTQRPGRRRRLPLRLLLLGKTPLLFRLAGILLARPCHRGRFLGLVGFAICLLLRLLRLGDLGLGRLLDAGLLGLAHLRLLVAQAIQSSFTFLHLDTHIQTRGRDASCQAKALEHVSSRIQGVVDGSLCHLCKTL